MTSEENLELFRAATAHACHNLRGEIEVLWKNRHMDTWGSSCGNAARTRSHGAIRHCISMLRYYEQGVE